MDLPGPKIKGTMSLEEAIQKRRSIRNFKSDSLTLEQVSQLLWAAQGVTEPRRGLRAAPSAGATYPLVIYAVTSDGVYLYQPEENRLSRKLEGDYRPQLCAAALGQDFIEESPLSIVITAVFERTSLRYGQRAARYVYIEAGHAAQNVHLQAVAMGLGSVPVGAFSDEEVKEALSLPPDHKPVYIIPVGYAR